MHKLVLSGIAVLAVLAILTGDHGAPAAPGQAASVQAQRPG